MGSSPAISLLQAATHWRGFSHARRHLADASKPPNSVVHFRGDSSPARENELAATKARKPYTITKQRERWADEEHQKFLEAIKLYGRAWQRIEEHIGTKTAVQIRSHAQKIFSKLELKATMGEGTTDIEIPPPRPKRKPSRPYPRKAGTIPQNGSCTVKEANNAHPQMGNALVGPQLPAHVGPSGPSMDSSCYRNCSLGSPDLTRSQSSLKLFGQTVLVSTSQASSNSECKESREINAMEEICAESIEEDLVVPIQKLDKNLALSGNFATAALNRQAEILESGNIILEGTGESYIEHPCEGKEKQEQQEAEADRKGSEFALQSCLSRKFLQLRAPKALIQQICKNEAIKEKREILADGLASNAGSNQCISPVKCHVKMPDPAPNQSMENYLCYHMVSPNYNEGFTGLMCHSVPAPTGNPIVPSGCLQPTRTNHQAGNASSMATSTWPHLLPVSQPSMIPYRGTANGPNMAAVSAWWPLQGFVPHGFVHPAASAQVPGSAEVAISALDSSKLPVKFVAHEEQELKPGARFHGDSPMHGLPPEPADAKEGSCSNSKFQEQYHMYSLDHQRMLVPCKFFSPVDAPLVEGSCRNTKVSFSTDGSEAAERINAKDKQLLPSPSTSNEDNVSRKRMREGSSSGSNTSFSGEIDILYSPGSDLSASNACLKMHHISYENVGSAVNLKEYQHRVSQSSRREKKRQYSENGSFKFTKSNDITMNGNVCPKMRFKNLEKNQHKDVEGSRKRLKRSAYDAEELKDISYEAQNDAQTILPSEIMSRKLQLPRGSISFENYPSGEKMPSQLNTSGEKHRSCW